MAYEITDEAEGLRRQVERALSLARGISDERAVQALRVHAASLIEQAKSLKQPDLMTPPLRVAQEAPAQQQQQIQPDSGKKD